MSAAQAAGEAPATLDEYGEPASVHKNLQVPML